MASAACLAAFVLCVACAEVEPQSFTGKASPCVAPERSPVAAARRDPSPVVSAGAVVVRPRAAQPMPVYPVDSLRCAEEGRPGVTMCIGPDGGASDVQLTDPSPFPRLNEATLAWARAGRHTPGTVDGVATTFCGVTFHGAFRLQDG